jgi:hypothetical protein
MKVRKFVWVVCFFAVLFSCSEEKLSDNDVLLKLGVFPEVQDGGNRIGMEEAMDVVGEIAAFFDEERPLRSGTRRAVGSVSYLLSSEVKTTVLESNKYRGYSISDTLAYVFNFKDSLGYVIISADARVSNPLLGFTRKGSLVNGETDNPGLIMLLERLEGYVVESIVRFSETNNKVRNVPNFSLNNHSRPGAGPHIDVEWGQGEPFWLGLGTTQCASGYFATGCVATAVAQIMAYWEYPASMGGVAHPWRLIKGFRHKDDFEIKPTDTQYEIDKKNTAMYYVGDLFAQVSVGSYTRFGCGSSAAAPENGVEFLIFQGYYQIVGNWGTFVNYNLALLQGHLVSGVPFMAQGCHNNRDCHAWVIDGFFVVGGAVPTHYIHNNWGWNGRDNGYFLDGIFNVGGYNFTNVRIAAVG